MQITAKTPTKQVTIQGEIFSVAQPFLEGHECKVNEAGALNQVLAENIRNNFAGKIAEAKDKAKKDKQPFDASALQAPLNEYVKGYEFGVRIGGIGGGAKDPIEKEAMDIAKDKVRQAIKRKGIPLKDVAAKRITELAGEALEKHPEWLAKAKEIVESRKEVGEAELEVEV